MTFEVAPKVKFHPRQCPKCTYFLKEGRRCRGYRGSSTFGLKGLSAMFSGETDETCPRFLAS